MACIVNKSNEVVPSVKETLVVQEFSGVFPNSLPKLAPERKVEFNIELA